jgi:hypothetical protein
VSVVTTSIVNTVGGPVTTSVVRNEHDVLGREVTTATLAATDALNDRTVAESLERLGVDANTTATQASAEAQEAALRAMQYKELTEQAALRAEQEHAIRAAQYAELTGQAAASAAEAKHWAEQAALNSTANVLDPGTGLIKTNLLPPIDGGSP